MGKCCFTPNSYTADVPGQPLPSRHLSFSTSRALGLLWGRWLSGTSSNPQILLFLYQQASVVSHLWWLSGRRIPLPLTIPLRIMWFLLVVWLYWSIKWILVHLIFFFFFINRVPYANISLWWSSLIVFNSAKTQLIKWSKSNLLEVLVSCCLWDVASGFTSAGCTGCLHDAGVWKAFGLRFQAATNGLSAVSILGCAAQINFDVWCLPSREMVNLIVLGGNHRTWSAITSFLSECHFYFPGNLLMWFIKLIAAFGSPPTQYLSSFSAQSLEQTEENTVRAKLARAPTVVNLD